MKAYTVRQINDNTYASLKEQSIKAGLSLNKFILNCLEKITGHSTTKEYHDLDEFIGTLSQKDANAIDETVKQVRKIDRDLWK